MRPSTSIHWTLSVLDNPFITVIVVGSFRKDFPEVAVRLAFNKTLPRSNYEVIAAKIFSDPLLNVGLSSMGERLLSSRTLSPSEKVTEAVPKAKEEAICFLDDPLEQTQFHASSSALERTTITTDKKS